MARRNPNVLKVKKQARMRRAYLKGHDMGTMIKVSRRISTADIPEKDQGYFNYRARGNTYWDAYLEVKFPSRGMISKERQEALRKARLELVNTLNCLTLETPVEQRVLVKEGGITKTKVWLHSSMAEIKVCFFMMEDFREKCFFKSQVYTGSECKIRAKFDLQNNRIPWVERIEFPTIDPDDPTSG